MWEFTAQPSAQWTSEKLWRAFVVKPWSKNDNKAHVSSVVSIDKLNTIANMSVRLAKIYTEAYSPHVLIMGAANAGCR